MNADELDRAYALLARAATRVTAESRELFLSRLGLLLMVASDDVAAVIAAIEDAEAGVKPADALRTPTPPR